MLFRTPVKPSSSTLQCRSLADALRLCHTYTLVPVVKLLVNSAGKGWFKENCAQKNDRDKDGGALDDAAVEEPTEAVNEAWASRHFCTVLRSESFLAGLRVYKRVTLARLESSS